MSDIDDTIVATSSPPGRGRRGLVRLSGDRTRAVLERLLVSGVPRRPREIESGRLALAAASLPVLAVRFDAGSSYTTQEMAEIQMPGHPRLLQRVERAAIESGARPAEPGEFTFRAFVAGRIDLTRAEGTAATIAAVSDGQLRAASMLRRGRLGRAAEDLVDDLAGRLALVEAGIDFTDQEDVVPVDAGTLGRALRRIESKIDGLSAGSRPWSTLEALPQIALVGPPSSGKSTLFNTLLGWRRAVVDRVAGTTRDVLAEPLILEAGGGRAPIEVMLVDVAGLDDPAGALDRGVQAAARAAIERADLILRLHDLSRSSEAAVTDSWLSGLRTPVVAVGTKSDLATGAGLTVSCVTGQGLETLRAILADRIGDRRSGVGGDLLVLQPRHEEALRQTAHCVKAARSFLDESSTGSVDQSELVAHELRAALDAMAGLGGRTSPDDVIGRVFATFCIGK